MPAPRLPLGQEGRCAEDGVSGVEERKKGRQENGEGRERACGVERGVCVGGGREDEEEEEGGGRGGEGSGAHVCVRVWWEGGEGTV